MKRCLLFFSFVFCFFISCKLKSLEDEKLIYYKSSYSHPLELWLGKDKIDFGSIQIKDILFDTSTNEIYAISKEETSFCLKIYKLQNAKSNKFECLEIPLKSECFEAFVFKNEFIFYMGNNKYILFNLLTNTLQELKLPTGVNYYSISGFDADNIYFDNGYFSLKKKVFYSYPSEMNFYRNRICQNEKKVLFVNPKNRMICSYDLCSNKIENLFIKCDYNYSSRSMYFLSDDFLFYSKYSMNLKNFFSVFFPGSNKELVWFKYNLQTGETNKVFQKNNGIYTVLGIMK